MALRDIVDHLQKPKFDPIGDIKAFHEKFGLEYNGPPRQIEEGLAKFRAKFMGEEVCEYCSDNEDLNREITLLLGLNHQPQLLEKHFDALIDLVYVALGTSYLHGFDFAEGWRRVHAANMSKVRAERASDSKRGSTFDVVKPEGWTPPDLSDLVLTSNTK
jgi:predicted HAD superfamily Cof-like phosphohydrolase